MNELSKEQSELSKEQSAALIEALENGWVYKGDRTGMEALMDGMHFGWLLNDMGGIVAQQCKRIAELELKRLTDPHFTVGENGEWSFEWIREDARMSIFP